MKWSCFVATLLFAVLHTARAQDTPMPIDSAKAAFAEAKSLCSADAGKLWGVSLCGPIMFVDAPSRSIVANEADGKGVLAPKAGAFEGVMPADQNISNTAVNWSGRRWTQMLWPLPSDAQLRGTLIMHELFHRIQDRLGLPKQRDGDNAHLAELEGRYSMQLEWRALARALAAGGDAERREAVRDALLFRAERYRRFPDAQAQEHGLEQNEGLAEYTGVKLGNPTRELQTQMALRDLRLHVSDATFVRSFAYATGPAYGLLLDRYAPGWRMRLASGQSLDAMLSRALRVPSGAASAQLTASHAESYGGAALRASEVERDTKRRQLLSADSAKFVTGPVLTLIFRHMNVQFNPSNLQPLGSAGTVYPTIRVTDDWGVIEGKNSALMKPDWSALVVTAPSSPDGRAIAGDGWTLQLKDGWRLVPGARAGDYVLASP